MGGLICWFLPNFSNFPYENEIIWSQGGFQLPHSTPSWSAFEMACKNKCMYQIICFCMFDLILYLPSTIFQLNRDRSSWVEPVLSYDKCVLLKDHNAVTPVRLEPTASRSRVKHSTTALPLEERNSYMSAMSVEVSSVWTLTNPAACSYDFSPRPFTHINCSRHTNGPVVSRNSMIFLALAVDKPATRLKIQGAMLLQKR